MSGLSFFILHKCLQWNLLIRTPSGPAVLSFVERLDEWQIMSCVRLFPRALGLSTSCYPNVILTFIRSGRL